MRMHLVRNDLIYRVERDSNDWIRVPAFVPAVSSVEDPEKVLDQAVEDMQNDLIKLRQAAAEVRC